MAKSDIRFRLERASRERHEQKLSEERSAQLYQETDPDVCFFRDNHLKLFEKIVKDCGRQLGFGIENRKPEHGEMRVILFKVYDGFIDQLFNKGLYAHRFELGSFYVREDWIDDMPVIVHGFHPIVHAALGSDRETSKVTFDKIPRDPAAATEWLNDYLFQRLK